MPLKTSPEKVEPTARIRGKTIPVHAECLSLERTDITINYTPLFFRGWFPNGKFDVAEQLENLNLESIQPYGERTAATAVCVNPLALLFLVIMFQRLDEME